MVVSTIQAGFVNAGNFISAYTPDFVKKGLSAIGTRVLFPAFVPAPQYALSLLTDRFGKAPAAKDAGISLIAWAALGLVVHYRGTIYSTAKNLATEAYDTVAAFFPDNKKPSDSPSSSIAPTLASALASTSASAPTTPAPTSAAK